MKTTEELCHHHCSPNNWDSYKTNYTYGCLVNEPKRGVDDQKYKVEMVCGCPPQNKAIGKAGDNLYCVGEFINILTLSISSILIYY